MAVKEVTIGTAAGGSLVAAGACAVYYGSQNEIIDLKPFTLTTVDADNKNHFDFGTSNCAFNLFGENFSFLNETTNETSGEIQLKTEIQPSKACLVFDVVHGKDKKSIAAKFELAALKDKSGVIIRSSLYNDPSQSNKDFVLVNRVIYLSMENGPWKITKAIEFSDKNIQGFDHDISISGIETSDISITKCENSCKVKETDKRIREKWIWTEGVTTASEAFKITITKNNKKGIFFNGDIQTDCMEVKKVSLDGKGWKSPGTLKADGLKQPIKKPDKGGWKKMLSYTLEDRKP